MQFALWSIHRLAKSTHEWRNQDHLLSGAVPLQHHIGGLWQWRGAPLHAHVEHLATSQVLPASWPILSVHVFST